MLYNGTKIKAVGWMKEKFCTQFLREFPHTSDILSGSYIIIILVATLIRIKLFDLLQKLLASEGVASYIAKTILVPSFA